MHSEKKHPKLLGAVFLLQAVAAIVWTYLLGSLIVTGDISASMLNIANNPLQMRVSIVLTMITAIGIATLGILLYEILHNQNKIIALVGMGLYLMEAVILAASRIPAFALLRVSQESLTTEISDYLHSLGNLFYESADFGDWLHMLPFTLGAILFYSLFFKSRYIPRGLSLFGLIAASLAFIGTVLVLLGIDVPIFIVALNFPFEIAVGLWLLVKGINDVSETKYRLASA